MEEWIEKSTDDGLQTTDKKNSLSKDWLFLFTFALIITSRKKVNGKACPVQSDITYLKDKTTINAN